MVRRGAVLFELLIAVLILSVGITACLRTFGHALLISARSHHLFESTLLFDNLIFDLASGSQPDLALAGGQGSFEEGSSASGLSWMKPYRYVVHSEEFPSMQEAPPPPAEEGVEVEGPTDYTYRRAQASLLRGDDSQLEFTLVVKIPQESE